MTPAYRRNYASYPVKYIAVKSSYRSSRKNHLFFFFYFFATIIIQVTSRDPRTSPVNEFPPSEFAMCTYALFPRSRNNQQNANELQTFMGNRFAICICRNVDIFIFFPLQSTEPPSYLRFVPVVGTNAQPDAVGSPVPGVLAINMYS